MITHKNNNEKNCSPRKNRSEGMRNLAKRLLTSVATTIIGGLLLVPSQGMAIPQEPSFSDGQVGIINDGTTMTIEQHVDKAIINWDEYSIAADELVQYIQPGIESIALNKITGANPSEIMGDLLANGQIFIMNPNGILFGPDSHVNTAGLLATTLGISDADFLEGNYDFSQEQYAQLSSIINKGEITISDNGYAVLVAPLVSNEGLIVANLGTVRVGAAEHFTVNFDGNSLINFEITTP
ncbi:MAG: filamentous hemagglutinin N-terminal domain-containing protein, partial [Waddliaceae bacterium]|nr:filamentous hemagglutinin N-terminal domain-containing protein [Waddliaceae bacterium]